MTNTFPTNFQQPVFTGNFSPDFPFHALPSKLKDVIFAVRANTQAPLGMIAVAAISAISLACQDTLMVCRPNGMIGPCSLYLIVIADSGERKSTVDEIFTKSVRDYEAAQAKKFSKRLEDYCAKHQTWKLKKKGILSEIKKLQKNGDSCDIALEKMNAHLLEEPKKPRPLKIIYTDFTPEALQQGLCENGSSAAVIADEGAIFFEGRGQSGLPMFNSLWSGSALNVSRKSSQSFFLEEARLTMSLMVQEKVFKKFLEQHGDLARDNGFFARCLVTSPESTQGTRFIQNQLPLEEPIQLFHQRMMELLELNTDLDEEARSKTTTLKFSAEAAARWIDIYNQIEKRVVPGQYFGEMRDYAAKMAENIARLAALFHYFEGEKGDISANILDGAAYIIFWFAEEFYRLFVPKPEAPQEQQDAQVLATWLQNLISQRGWQCIKKNYIRQHCPNQLRSKNRFDTALDWLNYENKIAFYCGNARGDYCIDGKTTWIDCRNICAGNLRRNYSY